MIAALLLIPLLGHAQVSSASVRLADLLAPGAVVPAAEAATVIMAVGPAPGSPLELSRAESRTRLQTAGLDPDQFAIPRHIEITRAAQPLEVRWVQAALAEHFHRDFAASSLLYAPPLSTATGDPGVVVTGARVDEVRGELEVRCRIRRDPALLPFTVAVRMPRAELRAWRPAPAATPLKPQASGSPLFVGPLPLVAGRRASMVGSGRPLGSGRLQAASTGPVLVHPGQVAALEVQQKGFQLVTQVMPLEAGRQGERIRALSLATHATLEVEVAGLNQVRAVTVVTEAPHSVQ